MYLKLLVQIEVCTENLRVLQRTVKQIKCFMLKYTLLEDNNNDQGFMLHHVTIASTSQNCLYSTIHPTKNLILSELYNVIIPYNITTTPTTAAIESIVT